MEDMQKSDPMKFTRERLSEIGAVWKEFAKERAGTYKELAKERADTYKDKLPASLKQYLQPRPKNGSSTTTP